MSPHQSQHSISPSLPELKTFSDRYTIVDNAWAFLLNRMLKDLKDGHIICILPSGRFLSFGDETFDPIYIRIRTDRLLLKLLSGDPLSLAEGNLQGDWYCHHLVDLFILLQKNRSILDRALNSGWFSKRNARHWHLKRQNTKAGSRRNIAFHYDLGNAFYKLWLDESMTYSSAFRLEGESEEDLVAAQERKYAYILDLMNLKQESSVLEIGCGWGAMALKAARAGHKVKGVTLSTEQLAYAKAASARESLEEHIDLSLQDYRDLEGEYDAIVSIEMIEAVGEEHWPVYFETISNCLKPGGRAVLQAITIAEEHFEHYRNNVDFIQRYIFPGGFLPSPKALEKAVRQQGLKLRSQEFFGMDYAKTLIHWKREFLANWPKIEALGFDARFKRMWLYYLEYCEAGFKAGSINVGFFVIEKPA
ncbi:MAG: cyclopropane-fatty-acyl-phospholipid synthase family protein [Sneathiellales bacterium]|nr:cyclopropane-fatty-acyl-phospholipid synthase family protein [Sneathiellales bacterium]